MKKGLYTLNKLLLLCFTCLLSSCAFNPTTSVNKVYLDNEKVVYIGEINRKRNEQLFSLFKSNSNVTLLEISSPGGDVLAGMELGIWIKEQNIDIKIGKLCASSCANYVFPAARNKYLQEGSIILWHGSSYQPSIDELVRSGHKFASKWREQEKDFFERIGVNYQVTTCGLTQVPKWLSTLSFLNIVNIKGFDYSIEDMERFGIMKVKAPNGKWLGTKDTDIGGMFRASYCLSE